MNEIKNKNKNIRKPEIRLASSPVIASMYVSEGIMPRYMKMKTRVIGITDIDIEKTKDARITLIIAPFKLTLYSSL